MNYMILVVVCLIFVAIMSGLAYYGYKKTVTQEDYLVGGRTISPFVMALSYGATFISTSALIGFGGVSSLFGFSLLFLALLNIVLGVLVAFAVFGTRIRRLSVKLKAYTFPDLLGKKYNSKFLTIFSASMIFLFMPAYTSIVLVGGGRFLQESLAIQYDLALFILALIVGIYVISGGIRAVMYTDAFGAVIMFIGMSIFLIATYNILGGVEVAHKGLAGMKDMVPEALVEQGHRGWTSMPAFGSQIWWTVVSTIIMGVGIGVLAQPQLAMRAMTVKNDKALYRSVLIGGIFIFFMTGAAFMIGPLSNLYFFQESGKISIDVASGNVDLVIPMFINEIMPEWFIYLFTLTLLSATISTISSLIHLQGTAFGEDILKKVGFKTVAGMNPSRLGVLIGVIAAIILAYILPPGVIARATAFWFGICAAGFLPALIGALFWKNATKQGAIVSTILGFAVSIIGFIFFHVKESAQFGISQALFGRDALLSFPWTYVDPLFYALPISAFALVGVSLITKNKQKEKTQNAGMEESI
ncbi:sodium:solute symporter family protein [Virgibacillus siamensis]|uniref:sodium:solute symporter family protein n=1 Tax=Virgibacillus siamensis TaxID=480071 RepID=UPI0009864F3E|nr:sodium:solute symporter family protein [Virgibacillus siamensis]